jgi:hypothetical protein
VNLAVMVSRRVGAYQAWVHIRTQISLARRSSDKCNVEKAIAKTRSASEASGVLATWCGITQERFGLRT